MKITAIETLRLGEFPNMVWVRVRTDEGVTGLGETYFGARAVEAYIHESAAPRLLGKDPLQIERIAHDLQPYVGFSGTGAETRGRSAIDVALWDLFGHATGQPLYQLLGGLTRDRIRTYNTCAGYRYVRTRPDWKADDWGLGGDGEGPYEDLDAFLNRADELAQSLLEEGITGMKIWPFDFTAGAAEGGHYISNADLDRALEPFRKIRDAVGSRIDIMVELHSIWRLPAALKIARALEPFDPFWYEDPVRMDSLPALSTFAASTRVPVCASETVASRWNHRDLLETGAPAVVMPDIVWCGGLTEARKIAAIADTYHRPVAPHDCTGPVAFNAAVHLSLSVPNALVQESVRAFRTGWYAELVTAVPEVVDGHILPPSGPGLGTDLQPGIERRADATVTVSAA
ncbi:MAG: mandelate racemase/muconate lactonizing enzyme family protein [Ectothiorhodospiraceae bacterium]|nr:mandelate racemase/muconate lactonizing enzyme family protein [Chromatiales bacterium]MCP5157265.1 mandelate racemase/muconate lactonizing enzyme family protein [Ectothiorhodospiraceae bacterium]